MKNIMEEISEAWLETLGNDDNKLADALTEQYKRFQETAKERFLDELEKGDIFAASEYENLI